MDIWRWASKDRRGWWWNRDCWGRKAQNGNVSLKPVSDIFKKYTSSLRKWHHYYRLLHIASKLEKAQPIANQHLNTRDQRKRPSEVIERGEITSKREKFQFEFCQNPLCLSTTSSSFLILVCRISPEESRDEDASKRRGKSAPHTSLGTEVISRHIMEKVAPDGGVQSPQSPPDPLEPWSTRDIKSINNILDSSDRE